MFLAENTSTLGFARSWRSISDRWGWSWTYSRCSKWLFRPEVVETILVVYFGCFGLPEQGAIASSHLLQKIDLLIHYNIPSSLFRELFLEADSFPACSAERDSFVRLKNRENIYPADPRRPISSATSVARFSISNFLMHRQASTAFLST